MNPTVIVAAAIASILAFLVLSVLILARSRRVSVPDYPLWPPSYFFPNLAHHSPSEGNAAAHSGVPVSDATNPKTPPHWPEPGERDPNATQAYPVAQFRIPTQSTGVPINDTTNPNKSDAPQSNADAWLDPSTNKRRAKPQE